MTSPVPLWNRVLFIAEAMDNPETTSEQLSALLCTLDEGFAGVFDPAEQFPEFAVHRLCRSIGRMLALREASAHPNSRA